MKINSEMKAKTEATYSRPTQADAKAFNQQLQSQVHHLGEQGLQQLIKDISLQGDKLARYRTFRELAKFKRMVKGFLQETVSKGFGLHTSHSFSMDGGSRQLSIVQEVDEKLVELTEEIMNQEKKSVDILGLIGEIKGLLINIYT
ncbi:YaaR family protein [Virgibacillus halodenitrificans]|uniref:YaaR family protein n=1 Tax=Virgibacillus halodenitrificans TaxID=1482 RepID=UPI000318783E|nr:YaaR family protein [Virgibacillus halodenitrificans]